MKTKNPLKFTALLLIMAVCFACEKNNKDDTNTISGILYYNSEHNFWEIQSVVSETIDAANIYIIKDYNIDLPEYTRKQVTASGIYLPCIDFVYPAGYKIFYITITNLKYK
jgi:hypothetical protein